MTTKHTKLTKPLWKAFFVAFVCLVDVVPIAVGRESGGW